MDSKHLVRISKFLSKHLRHTPEAIGLTLEVGGWVAVSDLLFACQRANLSVTREVLMEVVHGNDKQRFALDATGDRIRANQGHSVEVDLQLTPQQPPDILYHGTAEATLTPIRRDGIKAMNRHHVHLSCDVSTAVKVGSRHGRPVVLLIEAGQMYRDGHLFYCSDNGVWLVDAVDPEYLREISPSP